MSECRGKQSHLDGLTLVEWLMAQTPPGETNKTNEAITIELNWWTFLGGGIRKPNIPRFVQARNHVSVTTTSGKPCCGYTLHFRQSGRQGSELHLVDPSGALGPHLEAVRAHVLGWLSRQSQHETENQKEVVYVERLGEHALAQGDKLGHRLCQRVSLEIEHDGRLTNTTLAELAVWANVVLH